MQKDSSNLLLRWQLSQSDWRLTPQSKIYPQWHFTIFAKYILKNYIFTRYFHTNGVEITKIGMILIMWKIPSYILFIFSSPSLFCLFLFSCRGQGLLLGLERPLMGFICSWFNAQDQIILPDFCSFKSLVALVNFKTRFGWGAPGPCFSATHGRRSRAPIASYCDELFPSRNKFNIVWTNGPHIRY